MKKMLLILAVNTCFLMAVQAQDVDTTTSKHRKAPPSPERLMADLDENKDGKIAKDEVRGPLVERFDQVDLDGDGFLSAEELAQMPPPPKNGRRKRKEDREGATEE
jgi:Ca2+-binding EF-hand superfamily protein